MFDAIITSNERAVNDLPLYRTVKSMLYSMPFLTECSAGKEHRIFGAPITECSYYVARNNPKMSSVQFIINLFFNVISLPALCLLYTLF